MEWEEFNNIRWLWGIILLEVSNFSETICNWKSVTSLQMVSEKCYTFFTVKIKLKLVVRFSFAANTIISLLPNNLGCE